MRELFDLSIGQAYKEIRIWQEIISRQSRENFLKYITSKRASLKRKLNKGVNKR